MKPETIEQFFLMLGFDARSFTSNTRFKSAPYHFNVYRRSDIMCRHFVASNRKDYYKISLILSKGVLTYEDKRIEINSNALLFSNPEISFSWEAGSQKQYGYFCLFTPDFLEECESSVQQAPMLKIGGYPLYFVDDKLTGHLSAVYEKMIEELDSSYVFKYDLLRHYLQLIIHEAMKLQPSEADYQPINASTRITTMFLGLLDRQFPIISIQHPLQLKAAGDFAESLSVHVNHLNYAVKEVTGKTTTALIAARVVQEAKALLRHTDWTISQIAYTLGFEHPGNFNVFFRRQTGKTPKTFRPSSVK
jgi:AraC-like DNA-binding protein